MGIEAFLDMKLIGVVGRMEMKLKRFKVGTLGSKGKQDCKIRGLGLGQDVQYLKHHRIRCLSSTMVDFMSSYLPSRSDMRSQEPNE